MGEAAGALLGELQAAIREKIGQPAQSMANTCDVMVQECARQWPVKAMLDIATRRESRKAGRDLVAAVNVVSAKCREELESRWGASPSTDRAIGLLMRAVVVEFANLWFLDRQTRLNICRVVALVRAPN